MRFGSVSSWLTRETVLFHHALKTLSFGTTNYVHKFTRLKLVHTNVEITVHLRSIRQPKLSDEFLGLRISLLEMPDQWFGDARFFLRIKPNPHPAISVAVRVLDLDHGIAARLDHRHGGSFTARVVDARHPDF